MSGFFDNAIRSTIDLPLEEALQQFGVDTNWRTASSMLDAGGDLPSDKLEKPATGMRWKAHARGVELTHVLDEGAAQLGGLSAGDVVVAVDGYAVDPSGLELYLSRTQAGQTLSVHYFRHEELHKLSMVLQEPKKDTCFLVPATNGESAFKQWLEPVSAS